MRRLLCKLASAVLVFAIGLGNFLPWQSSQTLPYCQVARNSEWYHNRFIRVKARLILGSGGMYVYEDCDPVEALASMVELENESGASARNYVGEVLVTGDRPTVKKVDAIIEGHFDGKFSLGCWGPKYHIAASKIELVSAITDYEAGAAEGTGEIPQRTRH